MGEEKRDWSRLYRYPAFFWFISYCAFLPRLGLNPTSFDHMFAPALAGLGPAAFGLLLALLRSTLSKKPSAVRLPWELGNTYLTPLICVLAVAAILSRLFMSPGITLVLAVLPIIAMGYKERHVG